MSINGIRMTHSTYKGIAPAVTEQLANEVQFSLTPIAVGMPHARAGRLRAIASAGLQRSVAIPGVPTVHESGLPGFEVIGWGGMPGPTRTPRAVMDALNRESVAGVQL